MVAQRHYGHVMYEHVATEAPREAARQRQRPCREGEVLQGHSTVRGS